MPFRFRCVAVTISAPTSLTCQIYRPISTTCCATATDTRHYRARRLGTAEAMPSEEEISRVRQLISRVKAGLDDLDDDERASIEQAVAAVRHHRAVALGMPQVRRVPVNLRPERHQ